MVKQLAQRLAPQKTRGAKVRRRQELGDSFRAFNSAADCIFRLGASTCPRRQTYPPLRKIKNFSNQYPQNLEPREIANKKELHRPPSRVTSDPSQETKLHGGANMNQLDWFGDFERQRLAPLSTATARRHDPSTSHEAAVAVEINGSAESRRQLCLGLVRQSPGMTAAEIANELGLDRHEPSRRLPELRHAGLVANGEARECQGVGSRSMTWLPVLAVHESSSEGPTLPR